MNCLFRGNCFALIIIVVTAVRLMERRERIKQFRELWWRSRQKGVSPKYFIQA